MKKIFFVGLVALACLGVARCGAWMRSMDAQAFESCRKIHSDDQCAAWIGRGY